MALSILGRSDLEGMSPDGMSHAEALAIRVAQAKSRFIVLLEAHEMEIARQISQPDCSRHLTAASIGHYCIEKPVPKFEARMGRLKSIPLPFKKTGVKPSAVALSSTKTSANGLTPIPISHSFVSYEETMQKFYDIGGKNSLLWLCVFRPIQRSLQKQIRTISPADLGHIVLDYMVGVLQTLPVNDPFARAQFFSTIFHEGVNQSAYRALLKTGRIDGDLVQQIMRDWESLFNIFQHRRLDGKADELSAHYALQTIGPRDRAIISYGLGHGLFDNNPASFPDQLQRQAAAAGHGDTSMELIVVTTPAFAAQLVTDTAPALPYLRKSLTVYDCVLRQEWPFTTWLDRYGTIYGTIGKPGVTHKSGFELNL